MTEIEAILLVMVGILYVVGVLLCITVFSDEGRIRALEKKSRKSVWSEKYEQKNSDRLK